MTTHELLERTEAVRLTIRLRLISVNSGKPLAGQAVRLWHCDRDGSVGLTDPAGWVEFGSVFPAADPGRWPHVHFATRPRCAERLALPADACEQAYPGRGELSRCDLASVFAEGGCPAMASVTGDVKRGFVATRAVPC